MQTSRISHAIMFHMMFNLYFPSCSCVKQAAWEPGNKGSQNCWVLPFAGQLYCTSAGEYISNKNLAGGFHMKVYTHTQTNPSLV